MRWKILGDLVLAVHSLWVLAVLLGPLWCWRRPFWRLVHLGMMALTLLFSATLGACPLTYLENWLWLKAEGTPAYPGSFLSYYLWNLVYWDVPPFWLDLASASWFFVWAFAYGRLWLKEKKPKLLRQ